MYKEKLTNIIEKEQQSLSELSSLLGEDAEKAVDMILSCKGKVIFMGIGKSGHICKKLAATFASTGTPSFFVHCAESFHGDFGMIEPRDLIILVSNSGSTAEVVNCIGTLKKRGCRTIAVTKNAASALATGCDCVLLLPSCGEADHLNLAPTVSSTATLVLGDALACVVSEKRGFTRENFYLFHPGGALGKQLSKENESNG